MEIDKRLLHQFDIDGDGSNSAEELVSIFNNLGHNFSSEEAKIMIRNIGNKDDVISLEDLFATSEDFETSFNIFDTDGNGHISPAELRQQLTEFGLFATDRQLEEFVRIADADGDGKLDINEWKQVLTYSGHKQPTIEFVSKTEESEPRGVSDLWKTVNHIALVVSDVGRSVAFYSGVLGMTQILRPDFDRHGAWFTLGNLDLHLIHGRPAVHADDDLIVGHIALNCGDDFDVRKLMTRLRENGVAYRENISVPNPSTKKQVVQAFVRDPDGYYLEFCSCESLEEFLEERLSLQKSLWNVNRTKAALIAKSKLIHLLNLDHSLAKDKYIQSLKRWEKARIIKEFGADTCKDVSESDIAHIALKFKSPGSILSIIREKENNPLFENILKNYHTEHIGLIFAANLGDMDALKNGVKNGLDINYADSSNRTCLHIAAENGNLGCVTFLLKECLADPTVKDFRGLTPMECAKMGNFNDVVDFMEETVNNIEIRDLKEMTSKEYAHTKQEVIDWIKKSGHQVMIDESKFENLSFRQNTYGDIVQNTTQDELKYLLGIFNNNVPEVLLAVREKIVATGRQLFFPPAFYERNMEFYIPPPFAMKIEASDSDILDLAELMHAASSGNIDVLRSAHESGLDLNKVDYDMRTALHHCSAGKKMDCVRFLVEEVMVPVDPLDRWGSNPQDYAFSAKNTEVMEYLIEKNWKTEGKEEEKVFISVTDWQ